VALVVWTCPVHGVIDQWPDDGSPESRSRTPPDDPGCPGPYDEIRESWLHECARPLRREVTAD
jgi:hypothetical protein